MVKTKTSSFTVPLADLLEAGCHFGHQSKRWNPKMKPYIWQTKEGVHIFDLAITQKKLEEACEAIKKLASEGKTIIFIGTKRQAQEIIREEAKKINVPYIASRWLGGLITNWNQLKKSRDLLKEMMEKKAKNEYGKYTKKENVLIDRKIIRLRRFFEGLLELKGNPEAIFVIDTKREIAAIKEARQKKILVFAIMDSNADPDFVDYGIPANDDAVRSIKLIVSKMSQAVAGGISLYKKEKN